MFPTIPVCPGPFGWLAGQPLRMNCVEGLEALPPVEKPDLHAMVDHASESRLVDDRRVHRHVAGGYALAYRQVGPEMLRDSPNAFWAAGAFALALLSLILPVILWRAVRRHPRG